MKTFGKLALVAVLAMPIILGSSLAFAKPGKKAHAAKHAAHAHAKKAPAASAATATSTATK